MKFAGYSKTIIGVIIMLAPILSEVFGYPWTSADTTLLQGNLEQVTQAVGAVIAVYGRFKASTPINMKMKN